MVLSGEDKYWLKNLSDRNFTTLFIDGNHENHNLLKSFPKVPLFQSVCTQIWDSVYWLNRGNIYTIDGNRLFVFGGAKSSDIEFRKENSTWWKDEIASEEEMHHGLATLENANWNVDYILTHCSPTNALKVVKPHKASDVMSDYLQMIADRVEAKHWYCGHHHKDITVPVKDDLMLTVLYHNIIQLVDNYAAITECDRD